MKLSVNSLTRLALLVTTLLVPMVTQAQSRTVVTGSVQAPTGATATAGYVEFRFSPLNSGIAYRVAGTTIIAPLTSRCSINASGNVVGAGNIGACQVWGNNLVLPASTCYDVVLAPNNVVSSTLQRQLISGGTYDLSSPVFCPQVNLVPQYQSITTAPISANLVPAADNVFNLGDASHAYAQAYINNLSGTTLSNILSLTVKKINTNWALCDRYPGADESLKLQACLQDLPTGGVADGKLMIGAGAWSVCPFTGITATIDVFIGPGTKTLAADCTAPSNIELHLATGAIFSVTSPRIFTLNRIPLADVTQIFSGNGDFELRQGAGQVYPEWFGATINDSSDDTLAFQRMTNAIIAGGPKYFTLQHGTYRIDSWDLTGAFGLTVTGAGNGSAFGGDYQSRLLYNGAGSTAVIKIRPETDHINLDHFAVDCNNRVAGSIGLWLSNGGVSNGSIQHVVGHDLSLSNCVHGMQIGDGTGINNFNADGCDDCHFASNTIGVDFQTINTEFTHFNGTTFILSYSYHVHASVGSAYACFGCYFGVMDAGALAGLSGPFRLELNSCVSEIDQRVKTIDVNGIGALGPGSTIKDCWFPVYGDAGDVTINWGAWAPLGLVDTTIIGKTVYDTRLPGNMVHTEGTTLAPTYDSNVTAEVADPTCLKPQLMGSYNDPTDVDYYVEMTGAHAYKWKRTAGGAYTAAISMNSRFSGPIEHNMWIEASTCAYTAGSRYIYHTHKSGLNDISSGLTHEGGFTVETRRTNNAAIATTTGVEVIMSYDTAGEDLWGLWNATTSTWTCLFPGKYSFLAVASFAGAAGDYGVAMRGYKNTVLFRGTTRAGNDDSTTADVYFTEWMNEGDTMQFRIDQESGGNLSTNGGVTNNYLIIEKVTPLTSLAH